MKRLQFTKSWRQWKPGDVVERDDGVANVLLSRHLVVEVLAEAAVATMPDLECAASRTPVGERVAKRRK